MSPESTVLEHVHAVAPVKESSASIDGNYQVSFLSSPAGDVPDWFRMTTEIYVKTKLLEVEVHSPSVPDPILFSITDFASQWVLAEMGDYAIEFVRSSRVTTADFLYGHLLLQPLRDAGPNGDPKVVGVWGADAQPPVGLPG